MKKKYKLTYNYERLKDGKVSCTIEQNGKVLSWGIAGTEKDAADIAKMELPKEQP